MTSRDDYSNLSGVEKASLMMLALSEEQATKLFALMDEVEIREISQAMATLGKINSSVVESMFYDFAEQISSTGSLVGSFESTERLLVKAMPKDKADAIMEEIRGPAGRTMWDKLGNVNEEVLASFLKNEYPQTIAVVLSRIRPEHASKVMALLPEALGMEVVLRILRMDAVQKEIIDDIERTLRGEFMTNLAKSARRDTYEMVADIFNFMDRTNEAKFLCALEERNQEAAERVKSLMFTFDDLLKIDDAGVQTIMREVDKSKLSLALKGSSEQIKEVFFRNMSERAAKMLKDEMQSLGMVRVRDVDEAQSAVVVVTKDLVNRGEITIRRGKDDEQMIG